MASKKNIFDLIDDVAAEEDALRTERFIAPQVPGGEIRAKVGGLVSTYRAEPADFEGWGIYLLEGDKAVFQEEAAIYDIADYLEHGRSAPVILCFPVRGRTWVGFPLNASDAKQRLGGARPVLVHLVEGGAPLEVVRTRFDGASFWYVEVDRASDPELTATLTAALDEETAPEALRIKHATPERVTAYEMVGLRRGLWQPPPAAVPDDNDGRDETGRPRRGPGRYRGRRASHPDAPDDERLRHALWQGGGQLDSYRDQGDHWVVSWRTADGVLHTSAIGKQDLTVLSAGFCLDGYDRSFDLQSLVEVARGWDTGMHW
jgi:hypothetical protein